MEGSATKILLGKRSRTVLPFSNQWQPNYVSPSNPTTALFL